MAFSSEYQFSVSYSLVMCQRDGGGGGGVCGCLWPAVVDSIALMIVEIWWKLLFKDPPTYQHGIRCCHKKYVCSF